MGIKIISFDVDGTLVDQRFNDIIWEEEIPRQVAMIRGWDFEQAKDYVLREYSRIGDKDIRWYDINYWLKKFGISSPARDILKKWEKEIRVYPDVLPVLTRLKERFKLIIITCMPRIFLDEKIHTFSHLFERVFSTISDFKEVKSPSLYRRIAQILGVPPGDILHIGDHPVLDVAFSREAGYRSLLISRNGKREGALETLEEVWNCVEIDNSHH